MSPSHTALVLVLMLASLTSSTRAEEESISGRSARWDQEINQLRRQKRQTRCGTMWYTDCSGPEIDKSQLTAQDDKQYRNNGWLADIGYQGSCGNCWAFAATHAVTDSRNIAAMTKLDNLLSSQYTTRCAARPVTNGYGCCGGHAWDALKRYTEKGVPEDRCLVFDEKSSLLPWYVFFLLENAYKSRNTLPCPDVCDNGSPFDPLYTLHDYRCYEPDDALIKLALDRGHVVITSMRMNKKLKQLYKCGIFCEEEQGKTRHAAVIVDYGPNYWVIKNSWGPSWGEKGYFRVRRGQGDLGIGSDPDYKICVPLLAPDPMMPLSDAVLEQAPASCSAIDMSEPMTDPTVMSALEFGLEKTLDRGEIECPDGTNATDLTLIEFEDATVQSVAGTVVELIIEVDVDGCACDITKMIELTVFIDLNGTFSLKSVTADARALQVSTVLLMVMMAMAVILNAY